MVKCFIALSQAAVVVHTVSGDVVGDEFKSSGSCVEGLREAVVDHAAVSHGSAKDKDLRNSNQCFVNKL